MKAGLRPWKAHVLGVLMLGCATAALADRDKERHDRGRAPAASRDSQRDRSPGPTPWASRDSQRDRSPQREQARPFERRPVTEWPGSRPNPPQTLPSRPDPRPIGGDHRPGTTTPHLPTGNPAPIQLGHDRPGYRPSDRPADRPVFRPGDRDGQRRDDDRRDNDRWRRDNDRRDDDRWRRDNDRRDGHDGWCRVHNRRDDCWRTYPRYGPSVWLPAPRPYHDEGRVFIDCRARVYRDTVYVSACDLMRQFDGTYYWDPACGRASLGYGCRTAFVSLGSSTIVVVDGERRTILPCANAPVLVNGELYVPVRTVCEGLGIAYACDRDHIQLGSRFVLVVKF